MAGTAGRRLPLQALVSSTRQPQLPHTRQGIEGGHGGPGRARSLESLEQRHQLPCRALIKYRYRDWAPWSLKPRPPPPLPPPWARMQSHLLDGDPTGPALLVSPGQAPASARSPIRASLGECRCGWPGTYCPQCALSEIDRRVRGGKAHRRRASSNPISVVASGVVNVGLLPAGCR